jgi:ribonuclease P protein component
VLPAAARVHTRRDHRVVAQAGCRARRGALVVALASTETAGQPRASVIAGRRVGPAVVRNRVKRRLREQLRDRLSAAPAGSMIVIRALPGAAEASYSQLGGWVDAGLRACVRASSVHVETAAPSSADAPHG